MESIIVQTLDSVRYGPLDKKTDGKVQQRKEMKQVQKLPFAKVAT